MEDDAECTSLPMLTKLVRLSNLTELVKKPSNLTRTGKEKTDRPISHSLTRFVEPIGWPRFRFAESLTGGLIDGLAMSGAESRGGEVAVGFSG